MLIRWIAEGDQLAMRMLFNRRRVALYFSQPKHSFVIMVATPFWNGGMSGTPEAIWSTPQRRSSPTIRPLRLTSIL